MPPRRRTLSVLLKLALGLGGLAAVFLVSRASLPEIGRTLAGASWIWLAVAFSLNAVGLVIRAYRWRILACAQGDVHTLGFLLRSCLVGEFFNAFLPTRFGGDVVRIWDGSRRSRSVVRSSAIVIVERMSGILILFLFALAASLVRIDMVRRVPLIAGSLALGLGGLAAAGLFFLPAVGRFLGSPSPATAPAPAPATGPDPGSALSLAPDQAAHPPGWARRFKAKAAEFRAVIVGYRRTPRQFLRAMAWALVLQLNVVLYYFLIGRALHLRVALTDYFVFIPLVLLIQLVPITINGLGVREAAYVAVFAFYGISSSTALSFSFIDLGFSLAVGLVGAAVYFTRK